MKVYTEEDMKQYGQQVLNAISDTIKNNSDMIKKEVGEGIIYITLNVLADNILTYPLPKIE